MKNTMTGFIRSIFVASSLLVLAPACGKNKVVKAADEMADAVCACKDLACAQRASSEGNTKLMDLAQSEGGTEDDAKKILAATERAAECLSKLSGP